MPINVLKITKFGRVAKLGMKVGSGKMWNNRSIRIMLSSNFALFITMVLLFTGCCCGHSTAIESREVPDIATELINVNRDPLFLSVFPENILGAKEGLTEDMVRKVALGYADYLRGKRVMEWTDKILTNQYDGAIVISVYMYSRAIALGAPLELVTDVYSRFLLDADPEVRHLGAHMLLIANLIREDGDTEMVEDILLFCSLDKSEVVRKLTSEEHYVYMIAPVTKR